MKDPIPKGAHPLAEIPMLNFQIFLLLAIKIIFLNITILHMQMDRTNVNHLLSKPKWSFEEMSATPIGGLAIGGHGH